MLGCVWKLARLGPGANFAKRRGVRWQRLPGPPGIGDTAVERGENALRPDGAVRHATAVSRQGLPPHSTTLARLFEFHFVVVGDSAGLEAIDRFDHRSGRFRFKPRGGAPWIVFGIRH